MKYKVGDKVRVREDLEVDKMYGNKYFVNLMKKYKGKEFIIDKIWTNYYRLKNIDYCWTDEMLEPVEEGEKSMNIEKLNEEYKTKMDKLLEEYKDKIKEVTKKEEPFIKEGQGYLYIDSTGDVCISDWSNHTIDKKRLEYGDIFPFTKENKKEVEKEVKLITERRRLQNQMEQFARQNNEGEIDWNDKHQPKWFLYN